MLEFLQDLLFPKVSVGGREGELMTEDEWLSLELRPVTLEKEELQALGLLALDRVVAAGSYRSCPLLPRAIYGFKYRRLPGLGPILGHLLLPAGELFEADPPPILCPVPLHWTRRYWRGFNQAAVLAQRMAKTYGWEYQDLLRRTRPTGHQAWRKRPDRFLALRGAFASAKTALPERVILVDDLFTTGATLEECAMALKEAGVARVEGLVLARG